MRQCSSSERKRCFPEKRGPALSWTFPGAQEALVDAIHGTGKPLVAGDHGRPSSDLSRRRLESRSSGVCMAPRVDGRTGDREASAWAARAVGTPPHHLSPYCGTGSDLLLASKHGASRVRERIRHSDGQSGQPAGYTSKYIDVDFTPEYPFGFGLSYTTVEYSNLRVSSPVLRASQAITVSVDVANRGSRSATETVQLYLRDLVASVAQPVRKLAGFQRIPLKAGERRTVVFTVSAPDLSFYDEHMRLVTEPGRFQVWIAPDAARGLSGEFELR